MAYGRSQSDLATVRDQLSLDYAEDKYLNVVTANLGIERPIFGFSDAVWRAAVKAIALRYKQVRSAFEDVLEIVLGPEFIQCAILREGVDIGDTAIEVLDASRLPQCGTLTLDAGLTNEETLDYVFIDYANNIVYLDRPATQEHDAVAELTSDLDPTTFVVDAVTAGDLSITVHDSSQFPTSYPFVIVVGQGTEREESLIVTNNAANVLSLQSGTVHDHFAPKPSVIFTTMIREYGADALFITGDDTTQFPPEGYLLVGGTEVVEYTSNDVEAGVLNLKNRLTGSHTVGTKVELYEPRDIVQLAQVQVHGCGWHIYQTTPRRVEVYLPEECQDVGDLFSASYLHSLASSAASTTLAAMVSSGDTYIDVASSASLPPSGTITIEPGSLQSRVFYYKDETVADRLQLAHPFGGSHSAGVVVQLYQPTHTGQLLSGDVFNVSDVWAGPYVYDPGSPGASYLRTPLAHNLAGPTRVMLEITDPSITSVEVENASMFPTTYPYNVRVGMGTGNIETLEVNRVVLRQVAGTTVDTAGVTAGDTVIPCDSTTLASMPATRGYRIRIARGTADEEVAFVLARTSDELIVESPLQNDHADGVEIELVSDVLEVTSIGDAHQGVFTYSERSVTRPTFAPGHQERFAEVVQPLYEEVTVDSGAGFETGRGELVLNFGSNVTSASSQVSTTASAGATSVFLDSVAAFPGNSLIPYYVTLGAGYYNQEVVRVTGVNVGLNRLTLDVGRPLKYDHEAGERVEFTASSPEVVEFVSRAENTFRFSPPIVLNSNHIAGEVVSEANESVSDSYGTDFPLRMPPDVVTRLQFLFDLIRAAGVEVEFITTR